MSIGRDTYGVENMHTLEGQDISTFNGVKNLNMKMDTADYYYVVESTNIVDCQDYSMDDRVENMNTLKCQGDNIMCNRASMYGQTEDTDISVRSVVRGGTNAL